MAPHNSPIAPVERDENRVRGEGEGEGEQEDEQPSEKNGIGRAKEREEEQEDVMGFLTTLTSHEVKKKIEGLKYGASIKKENGEGEEGNQEDEKTL